MKKILSLSVCLSALVSLTPSLVSAQTPTQKVPMCLQVQQGNKYYVPCTGVVPVDTATGNALSWADLLSNKSTPANTASANATPVQNSDGTKIATDASVQAIKNTLGNPLQANGSVTITNFPATQPVTGTVTANIGTAPNLNVVNLAGTNSIGTVGLNAGTNTVGNVNVNGVVPVSGTINVGTAPTLNVVNLAGSNAIGTVGVTSLPSLPTGTNTIGAVNVNGTVPVSGSVSVANFPATQSVTQGTSPWIVSGQAADGTAPTNPAIHVAGVDSTGKKRTLLTGATGGLVVDSFLSTPTVSVGNFPATQVVSGNVATTVGGLLYTDRTITVSSTQATGAATIIAANPSRKAISITPASDGKLYITAGATGFYYQLFGGTTRTLSGQDCPTNALYITGQASGATLPIAEAQ